MGIVHTNICIHLFTHSYMLVLEVCIEAYIFYMNIHNICLVDVYDLFASLQGTTSIIHNTKCDVVRFWIHMPIPIYKHVYNYAKV